MGNSDDLLIEESRLAAEAANAVQNFLLGLAEGRMFCAALDHVMALSNSLDELRAATLRAILAAGVLSLDQCDEHSRVWAKLIDKELATTGDSSSRTEILLFMAKAGVLNNLNQIRLGASREDLPPDSHRSNSAPQAD